MKPLRLKMQAFGSYGKETVIDFEKVNQNLFLITGDTGAGKTTIFDAIVFALYGEASSSSNKKEGVVLQSQYVDFAEEPFVELTFAEGRDEEREIYTVRRIPRHLKTITRGAAKGKQREVTGSVSLVMPDGTEYPSKETDRKLQEITGLTKGQFMQVAMIAQGEFMDLLRAKSDDKKVIFRKLFNTEMYQEIVNELGNRKREKDREIAILKTQCQGDAGRIRISEEYKDADQLRTCKELVEAGQISGLNELLESLRALCIWLKDYTCEMEQECIKAEKNRDEKRDSVTKAEGILNWFIQLDAAEQKIKEYQDMQSKIDKKFFLITQIRDAYEINEKHIRADDAKKAVLEMEKTLKEHQRQLPLLTEMLEKARREEAETKAARDIEQQKYTKTEEKVKRSCEVFEKIRTQEGKEAHYKSVCRQAEQAGADLQKELDELEEKEQIWKKQSEELAESEKKLVLAETKKQEEQVLEQELKDAESLGKQAEACRKRALKCREIYIQARDGYLALNSEYEEKRQHFLDEQAGFLADELKPGKPCPVCGSTEHPHPHKKSGEDVDISRENLKKMSEDVDKLREKQEQAAGNAKAVKAEFDTRKDTYLEAVKKLKEHIRRNIPSLLEDARIPEMKEAIEAWNQEIEKELLRCRTEVERMSEIRRNLQDSEDKKKNLRDKLDESQKESKKLAEESAACEAVLTELKNSVEFESEREAENVLTEAGKLRDKAEKQYQKASKTLEKAVSEKKQTEALIQRYMKEIPKQKEHAEQTQGDYRLILKNKKMAEENWQETIKTYTRQDAEEFQDAVNQYRENLAAAQAQKEAAQAAAGTEVRPDLKKLEQEKEEAEQKYQAVKIRYDNLRQEFSSNAEVQDILLGRLKNRTEILEEHARIDALYRMVSGNVSGARMDLETYVQRYYLERILYAANRRFGEMSAGQFEFRMYDIEKAGEGKNRGLDLMIYSAVTGKEREVRTLSGGESFMAALSLALGMADQIQESSAAVNLDMMFIDEGFGSLDEHSRNQAVKVLQEMAEGSRLIGIISHVTELKQEIEDQLIVSKDENGSRVRWQIS